MTQDKCHPICQSNTSLLWPLLILLPLLACAAPAIPGLTEATPTPTPQGVNFAVQLNILVADNLTLTPPPPSPVPLAPTVTPVVEATLDPTQPEATPLPDNTVLPTETPLAPASPEADGAAETTTETAVEEGTTEGDGLYTGPLTDQIALLGPGTGYTLTPEQEQLEVKWQWFGEELRTCELPEGYGFDIRIWPSLENPYVPAWQKDSIQPLGIIDAVNDQDLIASSCNAKDGSRRFVINNLKSAPGVTMAAGKGQFFWDVAYVQLEPYYVPLAVSIPQDFFIPSADPPPVAAAPPEPTPAFQLTPSPKPVGKLTLLSPADGASFPADWTQTEFLWQWESLEGADPCFLPEEFGFEIRLKSTRPDPDLTFKGLFDAPTNQDLIGCDPNSSIYSYVLQDLRAAEAVRDTYVGENRWDGQFYWDVALVSLKPYIPPETAARPHTFKIFLDDYKGAFDPFGAALKCTDFPSWIEAQAVFIKANEQTPNPQRDLDKDGNGVACDELRQ